MLKRLLILIIAFFSSLMGAASHAQTIEVDISNFNFNDDGDWTGGGGGSSCKCDPR